ncbi:MAG: zinc ribbon domain-containing protein [Anaerolineales bacterium]|nr:zinc ribbon domain-containing protein [Anaerolineales bacterium]
MPIYDYHCRACHKRFDVFLSYAAYGKKPVSCPYCSSRNVSRRLPRVRVLRSEESRMESLGSLANPAALDSLEDDPRALGQMMRRMGNELGDEIPAEFDEVVDRLEHGQSPDEIEQDLPDLGSGDLGGALG